MLKTFRASLHRVRKQDGLYFAALLDTETINRAFGPARHLWQGWIYTPSVTVWVFLSQCLSADHSCRDAVGRLMAWMVMQGRKPCSAETSAYCSARDHLPETACRELVRVSARELEAQSPAAWQWHGRRVCVVDGSTITMPDTAENQAEYPQVLAQRPGCGFPIARILVVFSLSVGVVLEAVLGKYKGKLTGENSLFRTLHDCFSPDDIVVADRYFCGWFDLALLMERNVDLVIRKHQLRATDFRKGIHLGHDDHLVFWKKPQRPAWMTLEKYADLPEEFILREIRVRVTQRGFRTKVLVVVTTLFDEDEFTLDDIADLYRRRWQAELHLRSLKVVLQMDHLRCRTPHRVHNEFFMHLLAYNLVRRVMVMAALDRNSPPWQISFKGTLQALNNFLPLLGAAMPIEEGSLALLHCIQAQGVGMRPNRVEPRRVKRRPKKYKLLNQPRNHYKNNLT